MAVWTLIDTSKDVHYKTFLSGDELPEGCKFRLFTMEGGLREGVQVLEASAGPLSISVLPQRGMNLWKASAGKVSLGWNAPVNGPVHPQFVPMAQPDGLGWLWGFDEWIARCGLESNGAPDFDDKNRLNYPLHGRISNLPAHKLTVGFDSNTNDLVISGEVDESRLHFSKLRLRTTYRIPIGSNTLNIEDEIVNLSGAPGTAQMLYHINFGPPLAAPGSRIIAPVETILPRTKHAAGDIGHWDVMGPARAGFEEQVYFYSLLTDANGMTKAMLQNPEATSAVTVAWNTKELGCFTLWKNTVTTEDGYVVGLEPGTNFPNPRSFETKQGRVIKLPPGGSHRMNLSIEIHPKPDSVAAAVKSIETLRAGKAPNILTTKEGWLA